MNKEEAGALVALALSNFPNLQDKEMGPTVTLWYEMLSDMSFPVAKAALMRVLSTSKFFPTVADIREAAVNNTGQKPSWIEAWREAQKAVRDYGSYRELEGLSSLSPLARKTMESIGWKNFCQSEDEGVLRGQFRMAYESMEKRESELAKMPEKLKEMIGNVGMQNLLK